MSIFGRFAVIAGLLSILYSPFCWGIQNFPPQHMYIPCLAVVRSSPLENRSSTHFTTENSQCHALLPFACPSLLPTSHLYAPLL